MQTHSHTPTHKKKKQEKANQNMSVVEVKRGVREGT